MLPVKSREAFVPSTFFVPFGHIHGTRARAYRYTWRHTAICPSCRSLRRQISRYIADMDTLQILANIAKIIAITLPRPSGGAARQPWAVEPPTADEWTAFRRGESRVAARQRRLGEAVGRLVAFGRHMWAAHVRAARAQRRRQALKALVARRRAARSAAVGGPQAGRAACGGGRAGRAGRGATAALGHGRQGSPQP